MTNKILDLNETLPEQLEDLISQLQRALDIFKYRKDTMPKECHAEKKEMICVRCSSQHIWKDGHDKKTKAQMYKCADCGKKFNDLTNTVFHYSHMSYQKIKTFIECMNNCSSLRKTTEVVGINKSTTFALRHKIASALSSIRRCVKLNGQIEADEKYVSINLKGTKTSKMPRFSKPRKSNGTTKRGINNHKVCIVSAISDNQDIGFLEIAGTGPVTTEMLKSYLVSKIGKEITLITDCKSSYEQVVKDNSWELIQIKSGTYVDEFGNSLANINSYHSGLSTFLTPFHGVSTKHLQHYLDWYMYRKILSYTVETLSQPRHFFKEILNKNTCINYHNMFENHSGIDFSAVYSDYAI